MRIIVKVGSSSLLEEDSLRIDTIKIYELARAIGNKDAEIIDFSCKDLYEIEVDEVE